MILFLLIFFCIGLIFGSFSTVLIERWKSGKSGIIMGRSECPHCNTILGGSDLVPLFSYLRTGGKCAHCGVPISIFYPLAEVTMGVVFCLLGYAMMRMNGDILSFKMIFLLFFGFVTVVYILYDIRYMEIPDQIMVPTIYILLAIPFFSILFIGYQEYTFHTFHISTYNRLLGAFILYSFLYIQILIPGSWYLIKNKDWKHLGEILISYFTFPIMILIDLFWKKNNEENMEIPSWVGGGDLRIALFTGLSLGTLHGIASFACAYIVGSIIGIGIIIYGLIRHKKIQSQIPFGPFLGIGWLMSIVFYNEIISIYNIFIIGQ